MGGSCPARISPGPGRAERIRSGFGGFDTKPQGRRSEAAGGRPPDAGWRKPEKGQGSITYQSGRTGPGSPAGNSEPVAVADPHFMRSTGERAQERGGADIMGGRGGARVRYRDEACTVGRTADAASRFALQPFAPCQARRSAIPTGSYGGARLCGLGILHPGPPVRHPPGAGVVRSVGGIPEQGWGLRDASERCVVKMRREASGPHQRVGIAVAVTIRVVV